ncbi:phage tail protein [Pseudomonas bohemica]|uniref:phage tail protein n=1 Tax=Pseudomonas bohemica TaxID=2044872 RepID=UPI001F3682F6|nr:phage tail protein [Pseudomonas bohemica]
MDGLKGVTLAGDNVFSARTWATWKGVYPVLFLQSPIEDMESLGRNGAPQFTVTTTLVISARVEVKTLPRNAGAAQATLELEQIQNQIKIALINYSPLMSQLQQYPFIRSEISVSSEGESELAELVMQIGLEFYQGPEDFYPVPTTALEQMDISSDLTNVVDTTGVYSDAAFPDSVIPAPRTVGPDGRAEGGLLIDLPSQE